MEKEIKKRTSAFDPDELKERLEFLMDIDGNSKEYTDEALTTYAMLLMSNVYILATDKVMYDENGDDKYLSDKDIEMDKNFFKDCAFAEVQRKNDCPPYLQVYTNKNDALNHVSAIFSVVEVPFEYLITSKEFRRDKVAKGIIIDAETKHFLVLNKNELEMAYEIYKELKSEDGYLEIEDIEGNTYKI